MADDLTPHVPILQPGSLMCICGYRGNDPRVHPADTSEVPETPNQGRGVDLDRTEGDVGPIVTAADAGAGGHHADSRAAGVPDDGPVGHDHGGASSELEPAREGDRESDPPGTAPRHDAWWVVHADVLRSMLDRARAGEDPGVLYVELIANSEATS